MLYKPEGKVSLNIYRSAQLGYIQKNLNNLCIMVSGLMALAIKGKILFNFFMTYDKKCPEEAA